MRRRVMIRYFDSDLLGGERGRWMDQEEATFLAYSVRGEGTIDSWNLDPVAVIQLDDGLVEVYPLCEIRFLDTSPNDADPPDIVSLRKRLALKQSELASALGCSARTVGRWEQGKSSPRPKMVRKMRDLVRRAQ